MTTGQQSNKIIDRKSQVIDALEDLLVFFPRKNVLAEAIGIDKATLSRLIKGKSASIPLRKGIVRLLKSKLEEASYHLALFGAAATIEALGHGDYEMLFGHYRKLVSKAEARKFFELMPVQ